MKAIWIALMCITLSFSNLAAPFSEEKQNSKLKILQKWNLGCLSFFIFITNIVITSSKLVTFLEQKKVLPAGARVVKYYVDFLGKMGGDSLLRLRQ